MERLVYHCYTAAVPIFILGPLELCLKNQLVSIRIAHTFSWNSEDEAQEIRRRTMEMVIMVNTWATV